jgi:alkanesulfonate monooxygenase SsuD/methylene tetrahydromethanopterin reductase-like flavin-dependent oxidoreductase (luciferase family)
MFAGTPEQAIAHYRRLAAAGLQQMFVVVREWDEETVQLVGERVIPALAAG